MGTDLDFRIKSIATSPKEGETVFTLKDIVNLIQYIRACIVENKDMMAVTFDLIYDSLAFLRSASVSPTAIPVCKIACGSMETPLYTR